MSKKRGQPLSNGQPMSPKLEMTGNLFIEHAEAIEGILCEAVRRALVEHKRAGNPVAVWQNGRVVILQPEEIPVDENGEREA